MRNLYHIKTGIMRFRDELCEIHSFFSIIILTNDENNCLILKGSIYYEEGFLSFYLY